MLGACLVGITAPTTANTAIAADPLPTTQPSATQSTTPKAFQPGVAIDWATPAVFVDGEIVLREGPLEFFACFPGKEHESVIRLDATAEAVNLACGLVGFDAESPPVWDEATQQYRAPRGDLVDLAVAWSDGDQQETAAAHEWLVEVETGRSPIARPWVFCGSYRRADGSFAADASGAGVALVDFPDALLAPSRSRTASNASLWVLANPTIIPPGKTRVKLTIRAARPFDLTLRLDDLGRLYANQRYVSDADAVDLIELARRLSPGAAIPIEVSSGAFRADAARVKAALQAAYIAPETVQWRQTSPAPAASQPSSSESDTPAH